MKRSYSFWIFVSTLVLLTIALSQCKKDAAPSPNPSNPPDTTVAPDSPLNTDSSLNRNVIIIDSTKFVLNQDTALLNRGRLEYTVTTKVPNLKTGDVLVGATNGGYIRRIKSVNKQGNRLIIETSQGTMDDVFKDSHFSFSTGLDSVREENYESQSIFDLSGMMLYQQSGVSFMISKGLISLGGDWQFDFDYKDSKLNAFTMACRNASLIGDIDLNVKAQGAVSFPEKQVTLRTYTKTFLVWVSQVPVLVKMKIELQGKVSAQATAGMETTFNVTTNNSIDFGLQYSNGQWQTIFNKKVQSNISVPKFSQDASGELRLALVPYISFQFYGIVGPYASLGLQEWVRARAEVPSGNWDFYEGAWLQPVLGAKVEILGKTLADKQAVWNTDTFHYETPVKLEKVSGDNQKGAATEYLTDSLKVKVVDNVGFAQAKVPVTFEVTGGSGSVEIKKVITDERGIAATRWKLGSEFGIQGVTATAKKPNDKALKESPVDFVAVIEQGTPKVTTSDASEIEDRKIITGGHVTADGGSKVTQRGVCWGTSKSPTIVSSLRTSDGSGLGNFTSTITPLLPNTTYYVRAYATNGVGTAYGNEQSFKTKQEAAIPTLITTAVTNITLSSATSGGTITSDGNYPITSRGICYSTSPHPTIASTKTFDGSGDGTFSSKLSGLQPNTTYFLRAYASNISYTGYGNQLSFTTKGEDVDTTKFTDPRDGQVYPIVRIGTQIWMAKNLNYNAPGSVCYDSLSANCDVYGRLYDGRYIYDHHNQIALAVLPPPGWRVATDADFNRLINYLGGKEVAGGKMKALNLWHSPNVGATNSSGFNALPAGVVWLHPGSFAGKGTHAGWWVPGGMLRVFNITHDHTSIGLSDWIGYVDDLKNNISKFNLQYSIRCIKN